MNSRECTFRCPLPNGIHARPASQLAAAAAHFAADITLTNERSGTLANAKSVLGIVGLDIRQGDSCRVQFSGSDADQACEALGRFIADVLPSGDGPLAAPLPAATLVLPRSLRQADVRWHAGTAVCPGIGQGIVVVAGGIALPAGLEDVPAGSFAQEQERVRQATIAVRTALGARLAARPSATERSILQAHQAIATDPALGERIDELLRGGCSAGNAILQTAAFFTQRLRAAESAYLRERAVDVEDICLQLIEQIYGDSVKPAAVELHQPSVVIAENLTPRQLLALDRRLLKAIVLEHGGATSHAVILARSFNIPTLTGVADVRAHLLVGQEVLVDANLGIVISDITPPVARHYEREQRRLRRRQERLARYAESPAVTSDGRRLEVAANIATAEELDPAFAQGAESIGLFRTEMLFMDRDAPPSEEEQFAVYARAAKAAAGRPVIIRTIDIGGDKPVPYLKLPAENNPFLGYRGVRLYADHQEIFRAQLRAILRASAFGNVWLLVPMVCTIDEVCWIRTQIAFLRAELQAAGLATAPAMPVGIMVEVPSVAFVIDQLASEVDFFSIGTNDLAQYFFAVDRENTKVAPLGSVRHPAFLRLLAKIVDEAHRCSRWVGMCGEMTRSPRHLPLLIGLGLDEISMAAPEIPAQKEALARLSAAECRSVLKQAMDCRTAEAVEQVVATFRARGEELGLLDGELITIGSDCVTKEEAIRELTDAFFATGRTDDPAALEEAIWAREATYSTGLGHGFAIPHCRTDSVTANSIAVTRLERPIEWGSLDDQPVQCVIMLAVRESDDRGAHMQVLSRLARRLMHEDFRDRLMSAADAEAVRRCLAEELEIVPPLAP